MPHSYKCRTCGATDAQAVHVQRHLTPILTVDYLDEESEQLEAGRLGPIIEHCDGEFIGYRCDGCGAECFGLENLVEVE